MAKSSSKNEVFDDSLCSKACKKNTDSHNSKITELSKKLGDTKNMLYHYKLASKDLDNLLKSQIDNLLESQRSDKNKDGLGYSVVPPPPAQVYSPSKKDMSWTGLPEFADDTITDYIRPSPTIESKLYDLQNRNSSVTETGKSSSSILSKPVIKFVKAADRPTKIKTGKVETVKKPAVKYAELYRKTPKSSNVRVNQRNWNNLKSQQLGNNFLMKNKACFNCGKFDHLSYNCGKWMDQGKTWAKNNCTHKSRSPRIVFHKSNKFPTRTTRPNMNAAPRSNVNNARSKTTQDLMIILIQRVKRLERELKARTPPTKIYKINRGRSMSVMAWVPKKV
nr:ubiquitin hydrolase [Tanacetum cinerariifolium]